MRDLRQVCTKPQIAIMSVSGVVERGCVNGAEREAGRFDRSSEKRKVIRSVERIDFQHWTTTSFSEQAEGGIKVSTLSLTPQSE